LRQLRATEAARELLNHELVHRIKNILANVQGIVGQSLMDQKILRNAINARITALGATNDLLLKSNWQSASLRDILAGIPQMTAEPACILGLSQLSSKTDARCGRLPAPQAGRTTVERLIWLFSPAFGHTAPVGCS
jgi:hypothetical protein